MVPALINVHPGGGIPVVNRFTKFVPDTTDYTSPRTGDLVVRDTTRTISGQSIATIKATPASCISSYPVTYLGVTLSDYIAANTLLPPQGIGSQSTTLGSRPPGYQQTAVTNTKLGVSSQYGHIKAGTTVDVIMPVAGDIWRILPSGWCGNEVNCGGPTFFASDFGATMATAMGHIGTAYATNAAWSSTLASQDLTIVAGAGGLQFNVASGTYFKAGMYATLTGVDAVTTLAITAHILLTVVSTNAITATFLALPGDCAVGAQFDYTGGSIATTMATTVDCSLWLYHDDTSHPVATVCGVNPDGTLLVQLSGTQQV